MENKNKIQLIKNYPKTNRIIQCFLIKVRQKGIMISELQQDQQDKTMNVGKEIASTQASFGWSYGPMTKSALNDSSNEISSYGSQILSNLT